MRPERATRAGVNRLNVTALLPDVAALSDLNIPRATRAKNETDRRSQPIATAERRSNAPTNRAAARKVLDRLSHGSVSTRQVQAPNARQGHWELGNECFTLRRLRTANRREIAARRRSQRVGKSRGIHAR